MQIDFIGELVDFVAGARLDYPLTRRAALKDIVEALGVPHTEVGALELDDEPAQLATVLDAHSRARLVVQPNAPGHDGPLRAALARPPRFVLDTHLGTLARYLRLLGFDSRYANDFDDATLAAIADTQRRVLLTRDRGLLKRARVTFGRFVRADEPLDQLEDVFVHFRLNDDTRPFSRCSRCNTPLEPVAKADIVDRLEPGTRRHYQRFARCPGCDRLFWRGSHYTAMRARIDALRARHS